MPKWQGGHGGGGPSKKEDQNPYNDQRVMSSDPKKALYEICNKFGWPCEYKNSDGAAENMSVWRVEVGHPTSEAHSVPLIRFQTCL